MQKNLYCLSLCVIYNVIFLTSILYSFKSDAQIIQPGVSHIRFTEKNGLPSSETYDIIQDSKGYIWIGTDKGAVKYDGSSFEIFTTENGLTDNTIFRIVEDYKGRIWFITYNKKLCYYYNGQLFSYKYNNILSKVVSEIYPGKVITYFSIDSSNVITLELMGSSKQIFIDENGKVLLASSQTKERLLDILKSNTKIEDAVQQFTPEILSTYTNQKINEYFSGSIYHIRITDSSIITGSPNGIKCFDRHTLERRESLLQQYYITGFYYDFEGHLWCTSLHHGVMYIPNIRLQEYNIVNENRKGFINGIVPQKDAFIIVCSHREASDYNSYRYIKGVGLANTAYSVSGNNIPDDIKLRGIKFENPVPMSPFHHNVLSLAQVADDTFITINSNIVKIEKMTENTFVNLSMHKIPKIYKVYYDYSGNIWLGTIEGLYKINNLTAAPEKVRTPELFSGIRIQDIDQTNDSTLVIVTRGNGIYFWKKDHIKHYTKKNGLISNTLNSIWHDKKEDIIWLATNKGIMGIRHYTKNNTVRVINSFREHEGFSTPDILQIYGQEDTLFFTTKQGFGHITNINNYQPVTSPPLFYFDSLVSNNVAVNGLQDIEFKYDRNNVTFHYHGIAYKANRELRYMYVLKGIDSNWQSTKHTSISYYSLPPGNYSFIIKAVNAFDMSSKEYTLTFSIKKPFWDTFLFRIAFVLAVSFIFLYTIVKIRNYYKYKLDVERTINELKMTALQTKMNPHFIFNSLNSIQNYILKNEKEKANDYLVDFAKLIRLVLEHSDSTYITLHDELEILNIYVNLERSRLGSNFIFTKNIDSDVNPENCYIPSLLLQPFIENAIWHGKVHEKNNGKIIIDIQLVNNTLFFKITDNGIGVTTSEAQCPEKARKPYGTNVTKKRIELISNVDTELSEILIKDAYIDNETGRRYGTLVSFSLIYKTER